MYSLGRVIEAHDMPLVRDIVRKSAPDNYRFSTLVTNLVLSNDFRYAQVPAVKQAPVVQQAAVLR
jgi:hypothetical protein